MIWGDVMAEVGVNLLPGEGRRSAWRLGVAGVLALLGLSACSPTFNWREVRPPGYSLTALWPCKPETAQRTIRLEGSAVELTMLSCEAGGVTFALGALRLPAGLEAPVLLDVWKRAILTSLKAGGDAVAVWSPPLALQGLRVGWVAQGQRHDGTPVQAHGLGLHWSQEAYQLVVYGVPSKDVLTTLLDGLKRT